MIFTCIAKALVQLVVVVVVVVAVVLPVVVVVVVPLVIVILVPHVHIVEHLNSTNIGLQTGLYKVSCNLIFFPTIIFKKFDFLPKNVSPLPLFPTR